MTKFVRLEDDSGRLLGHIPGAAWPDLLAALATRGTEFRFHDTYPCSACAEGRAVLAEWSSKALAARTAAMSEVGPRAALGQIVPDEPLLQALLGAWDEGDALAQGALLDRLEETGRNDIADHVRAFLETPF